LTDNGHAYHVILSDARDFANHDPRKPWFLGGDFFRLPDVLRGLELEYDVDQLRTAVRGARADEEETRKILKEIFYDSLQKAIHENPHFLVVLILEEARNAAT
jgi:hypothetical protein